MAKKDPKLIGRKLVYEGKAFSVYRYQVEVAQKTLFRDIIERSDGIVVVPVDQDLTVFLIKEYCAGSNSFILSLPGGSIEKGELPEDSALRELREETGYTAHRLTKLHFAYSHPSTSSRKSYVFLGYDLEA